MHTNFLLQALSKHFSESLHAFDWLVAALATIVLNMTVFSSIQDVELSLLLCSSEENTLKLLCLCDLLFVRSFETRLERILDCWSADTAATGSRPEGRGLRSKWPDRRPCEEHQRHSTMACRGKSRFENLLPFFSLFD
jgi:hypothetical protein